MSLFPTSRPSTVHVSGHVEDQIDVNEEIGALIDEAHLLDLNGIKAADKALHKCTAVWPVLPLLSIGCYVFLPYPGWVRRAKYRVSDIQRALNSTTLDYDEYHCLERPFPSPSPRWMEQPLAETMHRVVQHPGHTRLEMASFLAAKDFNLANVLDYAILRIRRCTVFFSGRTEDKVHDLTLREWTILGMTCKEQGAKWWMLLDRQLWRTTSEIYCQVDKRLRSQGFEEPQIHLDPTKRDFEKSVRGTKPATKAELERSGLRCPVCWEDLSTSDHQHTPMKLPNCQHVYGRSCLQNLIEKTATQTCPVCRVLTFKTIFELEWSDLNSSERYEVFGVAGPWTTVAAQKTPLLYHKAQKSWTHAAWRGALDFWPILQRSPSSATWDRNYTRLWNELCQVVETIPFMADAETLQARISFARKSAAQWRAEDEQRKIQKQGDEQISQDIWYHAVPTKPCPPSTSLAGREKRHRDARCSRYWAELRASRLRQLKHFPNQGYERYETGTVTMWEIESDEEALDELFHGARTQAWTVTANLVCFFYARTRGDWAKAVRRCEDLEYAMAANCWLDGGESKDRVEVYDRGQHKFVPLSSVYRFLWYVKGDLRVSAGAPRGFENKPWREFWEDVSLGTCLGSEKRNLSWKWQH